MQKMIMIPEERWDKILETYDALVLELEEMKKPLKKLQLLKRASNPDALQKPDTEKIIPYSAKNERIGRNVF